MEFCPHNLDMLVSILTKELPICKKYAFKTVLGFKKQCNLYFKIHHTALNSIILQNAIEGSGYGADHSPRSSTKIKNEWNYTSNPLHTFMVHTRATLPLTTTKILIQVIYLVYKVSFGWQTSAIPNTVVTD